MRCAPVLSKLGRSAALVCAVLTAASCAMFSTDDRPPEEIVRDRAMQRWQAVIDDDYKTAYEYLSPGSRSSTDFEAYKSKLTRSLVNWQDAEIVDVSCEAAGVCEVTTTMAYTAKVNFSGVKEIKSKSRVKEQWVEASGEWFYVSK